MDPPKVTSVESFMPGLKRREMNFGNSRTSKIPHVNPRHEISICSCNHGCRSCCSRQSTVASNYENFLKSGLPRRIMFYSAGEWSDFPESLTSSLIEAFGSKKSAVKVSMNDIPYLFDFLSMSLINLQNGAQRSISWIDEANMCFFPFFFLGEEASLCMGHDASPLGLKASAIRSHQVGEGDHSEAMNSQPVENHTLVGDNKAVSINTLHSQLVKLDRSSEEFGSVLGFFLSGMGNFATPANVVEIHRHKPKISSALARLETFEQHATHIDEDHGCVNRRNGWLNTSKEGLWDILLHGVGKNAKLSEGNAYGTGIYLAPENRSFASVKHCDVDENGLQHIVLCQVILGNMEKVPIGSTQSSPSKQEFDCGVDDLLSPKCYVVWKTHVNTHIHPEYFITFRLSSAVQDYLSELKDIWSKANNILLDNKQDISIVHPEGKVQRSLGVPVHWMPFAALFAAIQDSIPPFAKELLDFHLKEMKEKIISRDDLIQKMRLIVGDSLLKSMLKAFKQNVL